MTKFIITFIISALTISLWSQDSWLLMTNTIHQTYINPAYQLEKKFELSGASIGLEVNNGGFKLFDYIEKGSDGINKFDLSKFATSLNGDFVLNSNFLFNTFDIGFKIKGANVFVGHSYNNQIGGSLSKSLLDIISNGNAAYIGQTVEIGPKISATVFQSLYLGVSGKIGKLAIGGKIKYLNGWYHLKTNKSKVSLFTNDDYYQLSFNTDVELLSTGILNYDGSILNATFDTQLSSFTDFVTPSSGLGFDIGLEYDASKKIKVFANAIDIGKINWNDNSKLFTLNKETELKGVNIKDLIEGKSPESIEDSIDNAFSLIESASNYTSSINPRFNAGIKFTENKMNYSIIYSNLSINDNNHYTLSFQATRELGKHFLAGISYNLKNNSFDNLGLLVKAKFGPVHMFACTQNIISLFSVNNLYSISFRSGLALKL